MKQFLVGLALSTGVMGAAAAAPPKQEEMQLRNTIHLATDLNIAPNSTFNPRLFDGSVYATQITTPGFGRYAVNTGVGEQLVASLAEHRMVAPFRGADSTVYLLGGSGAATTFFSRYDFSGENRVDASVPGTDQQAEGWDWVDDSTIIYTTYNPSANRRRLSLAKVTAEPFAVTADTRWNAEGHITTGAGTRLRNVRKGDVYSGFAYYGDNGQNANPQFFAVNLATGAETALGNAGTLTGSGSFGVWTVVERGGYLYVQTTDDGIRIYQMTGGTSVGALHTTYTKAGLDALTGYTGQYYGMDVSPDGKRLVLGAAGGNVYELAMIPPLALTATFNVAGDLGVAANNVFNPRISDGDVYAGQVNAGFGFGRYALGSETAEQVVAADFEHRMVIPFRGTRKETYLFAGSGAVSGTFSRYDFNGENRVDVNVPGTGQFSEGFDWVDDSTLIYTSYNPSASRKRLSLAKVTAEPFAVTPDTRWNANGYVTTGVSTRIRNVRVGGTFPGFAYYGDNGQNTSPNFYALNLATGTETLLGNAGTLTGTGSFGVWTVVERGGKLFVQTSDNGIQVYPMTSATSIGAMEMLYSKEDIDSATGYTKQYWGFDITTDARTLVVSGEGGRAWQLGVTAPGLETPQALSLDIARSGDNIILTWPSAITGGVIQGTAGNGSLTFTTLDPQPAVTVVQGLNTVTIPRTTPSRFFRLKK